MGKAVKYLNGNFRCETSAYLCVCVCGTLNVEVKRLFCFAMVA
jgi:hypothetical protein